MSCCAAPAAVVTALWRYPVKSLQGEQLAEARIGVEGLEGDRRYAIFDRVTGFGVTARRHPELLYATGRLGANGSAQITLPDGSSCAGPEVDEALSDWLGRPVTLRRADEPGARRYESLVDFEHESASAWDAFDGSPGAFHDLASASISLLAEATIGTWDPRRFRANILLDMGSEREDLLVGRQIELGEAALAVRRRLGRCVITTRSQPGGIERDLDVLRTINRERDGKLAAGAHVLRTGDVRVGDTLRVAPLEDAG